MAEIRQQFQEQVMGKMVCVHLKDDRKIYGQLICTDMQQNLVLNDAITEVDGKYNTPVNQSLKIYLKNEIQAKKYLNLPQQLLDNEEKLEQINQLFRRNKFWIGNVIIAEKHFTKIEVTKSN